MKYLVRAIKYFAYLLIILSLVILVLVKLGLVEGDLQTMFVNGYDSLWQIAAIAAVFSALYPRLGFSERLLSLPGSDEELRGGILEVMENRGYRLESETPDRKTFIKRAPLSRALSMWEDRITFTRDLSGYRIEGLTKHTVRIISALGAKFDPDSEI